MRKAIRISAIIIGALFTGNALFTITISNFNLGILLVAVFGIVLLSYGIFFEKLRGKKAVHVLVGLMLAIVTCFGSFLALYGERDNATYTEETVIVLGCGIRGERVSVGLAKRLDKAYEYYEKNPDVTIIVSGGQGPQEDIPEALAMKRYLVDKGVSEEKIIMEDKSTSTIENFKYSHEIMKERGLSEDSVVFVTNAYHVYRGSCYAEKEGLTVNHLGTDIICYTIPMNYFREMIAVLKMWLLD